MDKACAEKGGGASLLEGYDFGSDFPARDREGMIHAAMKSEDRFSVCEFSTMTASFEGDLEACKLGGAHGIGICEAKLPAGGDAAAR